MENSHAAVHCEGCSYDWRTAAMADGLRLIGSCPRCGGALTFAADAPVAPPVDTAAELAADTSSRAPHMVLGMPRGW
jgi:hypothetical protein